MLPVELWTYICSLSTFDDGYTVRSLGRVASFFREAAEPFRLRTLSVCNVRRIIDLTSHLESLPIEKRNVEFLYAACVPPAEPGVRSALASFYQVGVCDRTPGPSPEEILDNVEELLAHLIARLLTVVRTTVRIVHVQILDYRDFVFFPIAFERLEEFTLQGSFESSYRGYIPFLPANTTIRRLSMDNVELHNSSTLTDSIAAYAPQVTHVYCRLSNYSSRELITQLDKLLAPSPPGGEGVPAQFPGTLEELYIHPGRRSPPAACGTGLIVRITAKGNLHSYCESHSRVVLLKEEQYRDEPLGAIAYQQEGKDAWLDRIDGGLGCWDDSNRMVSLY